MTGGLRRVHIRGQEEIRKRILIHATAFNLSLVMRQRFGFGTPRALQGLAAAAEALADASARGLAALLAEIGRLPGLLGPNCATSRPSGRPLHNKTAIKRLLPLVQSPPRTATSSTAC